MALAFRDVSVTLIAGCAIGSALAAGLTRFVKGRLFGVRATDQTLSPKARTTVNLAGGVRNASQSRWNPHRTLVRFDYRYRRSFANPRQIDFTMRLAF